MTDAIGQIHEEAALVEDQHYSKMAMHNILTRTKESNPNLYEKVMDES